MAKQIAYSEDARLAIKRGVDILARVVGVTLGPRGRNVIIDRKFGFPQVTKDGVSVAKEIDLEDPNENLGAQLLREVAEKTSDQVGDGTTSSTVLAQYIVNEGLRNVTAGANPMAIKRGIDIAVVKAVEAIKKNSTPIHGKEDIKAVATISANNEAEIGEQIAQAMEKVTKDGVITVEESHSSRTELKVVEGMQFDRGFISHHFVTDAESMEVVLKDVLILIYEKKISALHEFVPLLEQVARGGHSLLVIAEDVEGESLAGLVVNKIRGLLKVAAVKAPGYGDRRKEVMEDIAVLTKGKFFSEELGIKLENVNLTDLGKAQRIVIDKDNTTIIDGAATKAEIQARVERIRKQIENTDSTYDKEKLQERAAKLSGGVAVIHVGASTEAELKVKKQRIENALNSARAAAAEGIVPGGGVALLRASEALRSVKLEGDEQIGVNIVRNALQGPAFQIAENAGFDGHVTVKRLLEEKGNFGFNAETGEFEDLVKAGVIDPTKVVRTVLENAASIGSMILTTEAIVSDQPEEKEEDKKKDSKSKSRKN